MSLEFSDGTRHSVSLITDRPGGFSDAELELVKSLRSYIARLTEIQVDRYLALTLLDTYVGHRTGERILKGTIRRGSGQTINAVIWLSDLREFTRLSNQLPRDAVIELLNAYFEVVGDAVTEAGGEILKFIGDAMLAIQPLDSPGETRDACRRALECVGSMCVRADEVNRQRDQDGKLPIDFGLALHVGDVLYGNIGTENRLDFTVIGPAVNEVARIQSLSASLGASLLMSKRFVDEGGISARSLGLHEAKGFNEPIEVFEPVGAALRAGVAAGSG